MASTTTPVVSLAELNRQLSECATLSHEELQILQGFATECGLFDLAGHIPNSDWSPAGSIHGGSIKVAKQIPIAPERIYKIRGVTVLKHSVTAIKEGVFNKEAMMKWDPMLREMAELEVNEDFAATGVTRVLAYSRFGVPGFSSIVNDRDFLSRVLAVHLPSGILVAMIESIPSTEEVPLPHRSYQSPAKGVVRAHLGASGWVLVPNGDGTTLVSMILQVDPMGWIPAAVTNFASTSIPYNLVRLDKVLKKLGEGELQRLKQQREEHYKKLPRSSTGGAKAGDKAEDSDVALSG